MSEIKIKGNSSGGGIYTLESGAGSTDRTITLPDATGTLLDNTNNTFFTTDFWRLTADVTATTTGMAITSNLGKAGVHAGFVGSGMTESSGVFTFPSTGVWRVASKFMMERYDTNSIIQTRIWTTNDNTNYTRNTAEGWTNSDDNITIFNEIHFDVTDTSLCKLYFGCQAYSNAMTMKGSTVENETSFLFQRLGDT
tara:strand:+ start:355 stop:942 length:588 start_codon:yes stop_codon:yes gene_type:complete